MVNCTHSCYRKPWFISKDRIGIKRQWSHIIFLFTKMTTFYVLFSRTKLTFSPYFPYPIHCLFFSFLYNKLKRKKFSDIISDLAKPRSKSQTWAASSNNQLSNNQKTQNTQIQASKRQVRKSLAMVAHLYISNHTHKVQYGRCREKKGEWEWFSLATLRHVVTERLDSPWPNAPIGKYWIGLLRQCNKSNQIKLIERMMVFAHKGTPC